MLKKELNWKSWRLFMKLKGRRSWPPSIIARRLSLRRAARASIKNSLPGTRPRLRSWKPTTEGGGNHIGLSPLRRESHQSNTINITRLATQLLCITDSIANWALVQFSDEALENLHVRICLPGS